jgi:Na+-translocating ferredoxin:NAD+ oxidoreductase RnfC subunit
MADSPFVLTKSLETRLNGSLSGMDIYALDKPIQKILDSLRRELVDARLDVRDYELSETRQEQLAKALEAKRRLDHIRKLILAASEHDLFGAVDVAQLSAQIEQIIGLLI